MLARPQPDEHDPYYSRYISLVADGDIVSLLDRSKSLLRVHEHLSAFAFHLHIEKSAG